MCFVFPAIPHTSSLLKPYVSMPYLVMWDLSTIQTLLHSWHSLRLFQSNLRIKLSHTFSIKYFLHSKEIQNFKAYPGCFFDTLLVSLKLKWYFFPKYHKIDILRNSYVFVIQTRTLPGPVTPLLDPSRVISHPDLSRNGDIPGTQAFQFWNTESCEQTDVNWTC